MQKDYYEVLQVERGADANTIKKAYRKVAMECHPDRNPGDSAAEDRFKAASEAYEVLSDEKKRAAYDRFGHAGVQGGGFQGGGGDPFGSMGDIFDEFFGGAGFGRSGHRGRAGADRQVELQVSFEEAALGAEKTVQVDRTAPCAPCDGSGAAPGSSPVTCAQCQGTGQVTARQGFFVLQTTCHDCRGAGQTIGERCGDCRGQGVTRERKSLSVKIPAGIESQMQLVLRGEGDAGAGGGPAGDLYVFVHVAAHADFERRDDDVVGHVAISFAHAALGTKVEVPTLAGQKELEIPAGTAPGTELCFRGQGIANVRSGRRGDHVVRVDVIVPKKLSRKQRKLLEAFLEESDA